MDLQSKNEREADLILKKRRRKAAVLKAHQEWLKNKELNCYSVVDKTTGKKVVKIISDAAPVRHSKPWNEYPSKVVNSCPTKGGKKSKAGSKGKSSTKKEEKVTNEGKSPRNVRFMDI